MEIERFPESYERFLEVFPTEKAAYDLIYEAKTTFCHNCNGFREIVRPSNKGRKVYCRKCKKMSSITTDTIFNKTHLDLRIWFYIIYVIRYSPHYVPLLWIAREVKSNSYNTIWSISNKVKSAIYAEDDQPIFNKIFSKLKDSNFIVTG